MRNLSVPLIPQEVVAVYVKQEGQKDNEVFNVGRVYLIHGKLLMENAYQPGKFVEVER
jgi:hypothetical protein